MATANVKKKKAGEKEEADESGICISHIGILTSSSDNPLTFPRFGGGGRQGEAGS
jgi:hypothetical protein